MSKFRPKKLKLLVLPENWHLEDAGILKMLILIPTLIFWISNPKSIFGQIWAKISKVASFAGKLAHMVSRGYWFLLQRYFSEFPALNPFMGEIGLKNYIFDILTPKFFFSNSDPKSHFWASLLLFLDIQLV